MFNQTCTVSRPSTSSVNGILTKSFATVGTYDCRIGGLRIGSENTKSGASDWVGDRRTLYLSADASVQKNDKITLDGEEYRVVNFAKMRGQSDVIFITCEIINWK